MTFASSFIFFCHLQAFAPRTDFFFPRQIQIDRDRESTQGNFFSALGTELESCQNACEPLECRDLMFIYGLCSVLIELQNLVETKELSPQNIAFQI